VKALKKKLRHIAEIRDKSNAGITLTPDQISKLSLEGQLKKQLVVLENEAQDKNGQVDASEDEDNSDFAKALRLQRSMSESKNSDRGEAEAPEN
jgi:hypothetical protein